MTDEGRGLGGAVGPPWSVDVLADLHAGVLSEREAAELWPRVNADPEARAIIEALDATSADLASLTAAPIEPMPADVAARIEAAITQESNARDSNVVSIDVARKRRNKRAGWGAGFLAAAAAVVAAVVITVPGAQEQTGGVAEPAPSDSGQADSEAPLALQSDNLGSALGEINGVRDFGPVGDQQRLAACVEANGIDPAVKPVGFRPATIDGQEALIVLYTTGELAQYRLIALSPECGPGNPGLLKDEVIGR
ncbi:hypothetical protein BAY61_31645 [Prauserella marina]|uniref:Uncharacterized protein n=1 Tax=Prauserella marina TaxID=530584 RepID=A0A222VYB1_9PSEU|nr:hypothetical protein [Prauserella marina]ASR38802.1 hypothetical protein BAY61_31645 [Prauserella marina]PWV82164.1 hypothetical protein DES30_102400 [Prauserella marina]SDD20669.1 hypothetical protein SAMN05421630_106400 [Prauserella marina]